MARSVNGKEKFMAPEKDAADNQDNNSKKAKDSSADWQAKEATQPENQTKPNSAHTGNDHACSCGHGHPCHSAEEEDPHEAEVRELTELLQRVHADFVNYKRRIEEESKMMAQCASEDLIEKLLPILDNFELALQHKDNNAEFTKGIELIYSQLLDTLKKEGLAPIDAVGKKFNPREHEALMTEKSGREEGIVIEEFQKGFKLGDKVLRHSKVKISKK